MSRRLLVVAGLLAACAVAVVLLAGGRGESAAGGYRVDVVFDNARGLIPGQLVQVAGGRVGKIEEVGVTNDFKARISMVVDERFAPFREDARCTIRPQGLIAENYVQCDPGRPDAPELRGSGDTPPTVPVERTSQPVNLTDLFELWNVPTRDRLTVLVSELGISTAARGEDIDAILRRVNPALGQARKVIRLLVAQRDELLGAIDSSDAALVKLVGHRDGTRRLLRRASSVLTVTGGRAGEIAESTRVLPGLLRDARPALASLDAVAERSLPLLASLNRSAPTVLELTEAAPALARVARPTLAKLRPVFTRGVGIVKRAVPLSRALRIYARQSLPSARLAGELLPNLDERGFPDNLMRFFFYAALATARFDETSHILPAHIDFSSCASYATTPQPGCRAGGNSDEAASTTRLMDYLLK